MGPSFSVSHLSPDLPPPPPPSPVSPRSPPLEPPLGFPHIRRGRPSLLGPTSQMVRAVGPARHAPPLSGPLSDCWCPSPPPSLGHLLSASDAVFLLSSQCPWLPLDLSRRSSLPRPLLFSALSLGFFVRSERSAGETTPLPRSRVPVTFSVHLPRLYAFGAGARPPLAGRRERGPAGARRGTSGPSVGVRGGWGEGRVGHEPRPYFNRRRHYSGAARLLRLPGGPSGRAEQIEQITSPD